MRSAHQCQAVEQTVWPDERFVCHIDSVFSAVSEFTLHFGDWHNAGRSAERRVKTRKQPTSPQAPDVLTIRLAVNGLWMQRRSRSSPVDGGNGSRSGSAAIAATDQSHPQQRDSRDGLSRVTTCSRWKAEAFSGYDTREAKPKRRINRSGRTACLNQQQVVNLESLHSVISF